MKEIKNTIFYASFPLGFISLVFPVYAASFGARGMEIGLLYSIFSIISIAMRPIVGRLIDRKSRKLGILLGVVLYLLANLTYFFALNYNWLLIARIIQSFGASFLWISIDTYVADVSYVDNRSTNYGISEQIGSKGEFIGSFIGFTILLNKWGNDPFKIVFLIFTFTSLLALIHSFKNIKEDNQKCNETENSFKRYKHFNKFLIIIFIFSIISSLTTPVFLLYIQDHITEDLALITFLFIPSSILYMFLPRRFGAIADKVSREKIVFLGVFLIALLQLFIPFSKDYKSYMFLYTIIAIVGMFYSPALSSLIIDFVGEEKRGSSYGLYSLASGLGTAIGPIIGATIYETIGNSIVFYTKGLLLSVFTICVCYIYYKGVNTARTSDKL